MRIRETVKKRVAEESNGDCSRMAVVLVGDDPASRVYVNTKKKTCHELGIYSEEHTYDNSVTQKSSWRRLQIKRRPEDQRYFGAIAIAKHLNADRIIGPSIPGRTWTVFTLSMWENWFWACRAFSPVHQRV